MFCYPANGHYLHHKDDYNRNALLTQVNAYRCEMTYNLSNTIFICSSPPKMVLFCKVNKNIK